MRARHAYPTSVHLFEQGALVQEVYWLQEGLVKLVHVDGDGRERILDLRLPGSLVGGALVVLNAPSPVSAVTVTRCIVRPLSGADFTRALASDAGFAWEMHQMQSREVYRQLQRLADLTVARSRTRLERFLAALMESVPASRRGGRLQLPLKRGELAQLLLITAEHLSRLFRQLTDEGIVGFEKGWLVVLKPDRLSRSVDSITDPRSERKAPVDWRSM